MKISQRYPNFWRSFNLSLKWSLCGLGLVLIGAGLSRFLPDSGEAHRPQETHRQRSAAMPPDWNPPAYVDTAATPETPSTWDYWDEDDAMGRGKISHASIQSTEWIGFLSSGAAPHHATLDLQTGGGASNKAVLSVPNGIFDTRDLKNCSISARFGDWPIVKFGGRLLNDYDMSQISIGDYSRFFEGVRSVDTVRIEAEFYGEGMRVFTFDVREMAKTAMAGR